MRNGSPLQQASELALDPSPLLWRIYSHLQSSMIKAVLFIQLRITVDSCDLNGTCLLSSSFLILFSDGLLVHTVAGMIYNPFSGYWHWSDNTSLNYAAHAVKSSAQERPEPAAAALQGDAETLHAKASSSRVNMKS